MRVVVLGGGVIGVTSAYYLALAGHEVVVVDRQSAPALETSFANAGEISPGYASPWAAPGIPLKALRWLVMTHAPLIVRPNLDGRMYGWMLAMLANCTDQRYAINKERMVRLAEFSRDQLIALRQATDIRYDERAQGTLQLFREQKQLDAIDKDIDVLRKGGVAFQLLDREACILAEPGLAHARDPFVGGLRLPNDETGDCFKFTQRLAQLAEGKGVHFRFGETIERLDIVDGHIESAITSKGRVSGDCFVLALGSFSPTFVRSLGLNLPVYPVKGYSITAPILDEARAPASTLLDETYKIAITRLGDRIRVGGMAELSGFSSDLPERRRATLLRSLTSLFPDATSAESTTFWSGLRPMTPDSTPIVGPTKIANLFTNTGHGTLGWTMACGSAHILADIVSGRTPLIRTDDLAVGRYGDGR